MQYNKTTGKIFEDDPNVRIPQKDLVNQIQKEQDQKEIYPSGMGDEKNYKSDPRTPNQRKKDAWAEKIAKKPLPKDWKPKYLNGNVIDITPLLDDQWWEILGKESYPWDDTPDDTRNRPTLEEAIGRIAYQRELAEDKLPGLNEEFVKQKLRERMS